jgi:hypothetical protein
MGGSSPNPSNYIPQPNNQLAMAQMSMQERLGENALLNQNKMLELATSIPNQAYTPDVYGPSGQLQQANKVAAINAYNSQKLEQQQNPAAYQARQAIQQSAAQDVSPSFWQNTMNHYGKQTGLV